MARYGRTARDLRRTGRPTTKGYKILSAGRLHDARTEGKAEAQNISGSALEHETAFGYRASFGGERKLSRDARPNRPALEA